VFGSSNRQYMGRHFYRSSAVFLIVILSVFPFVTCMLCDKMKEHTADILIPHERAITLVF